MDSAYIQQKDAEYLNKEIKKNGEQLIEPLYTPQDVLNALGNFQGIPYHKEFTIIKDPEFMGGVTHKPAEEMADQLDYVDSPLSVNVTEIYKIHPIIICKVRVRQIGGLWCWIHSSFTEKKTNRNL